MHIWNSGVMWLVPALGWNHSLETPGVPHGPFLAALPGTGTPTSHEDKHIQHVEGSTQQVP